MVKCLLFSIQMLKYSFFPERGVKTCSVMPIHTLGNLNNSQSLFLIAKPWFPNDF
jgi:hypothetical protein